MHRVRSFDLEHISLFSTMSDEEIDSIIGLHCTPRNFTTNTFEMGYTVQSQRKPRVDPRNTAFFNPEESLSRGQIRCGIRISFACG